MRIVSLKEQAGIGGRRSWRGSDEEDGKGTLCISSHKGDDGEPVMDAATGEAMQEPVFDKTAMRCSRDGKEGLMLLR